MSLSGRRSSGLPVREWEGRRWDFVVKSCHLQATYLSLSVRRSYGLPVRDREGRRWDFVVKSWANGTEHRRVYVLEHALEFISAQRLREGDAIGLCADAQGALVVDVSTHT